MNYFPLNVFFLTLPFAIIHCFFSYKWLYSSEHKLINRINGNLPLSLNSSLYVLLYSLHCIIMLSFQDSIDNTIASLSFPPCRIPMDSAVSTLLILQ